MDSTDQFSSSRSVVRSGFFNLVGFVVSAAYMLILVPVAVHYLGDEQYGLWMTVLALTGYIGLADLGLSSSFVTYIARFVAVRSYDQATRVVHFGLLFYAALSIVLFGVTLLVYPYLFDILHIPAGELITTRNALFLVLAVFALTSASGVLSNALASIQRTDLVNLVTAMSLVVKLAGALMVLHLGFGLLGLLAADLCVTATTIPILILLTRRHMPFLGLKWKGYDHDLMKKLLGFGASMQVTRLADIVLGNFDKLLLTRFLGFSMVSMYDFGAKPAGRLRVFPASAILSLVAAVSALDAQGNEARIRAALVRSTRYLAIVSAPLFGFCIVFAEPLMHAWLGPGKETAAMTLRLLSIGFFVSSVVSAPAAIAVGRGQPQYQMWAMLVQAVLNILLSTILILTFGFFGAVAGTTIATLTGGLLFFWMFGRGIVERPLRVLFSILVRPVGCAAAAAVAPCVALLLLRDALANMGQVALACALLLAALAFVAQYACVLWWTRTVDADDMRFAKGVLPHRLSARL